MCLPRGGVPTDYNPKTQLNDALIASYAGLNSWATQREGETGAHERTRMKQETNKPSSLGDAFQTELVEADM